ncbi:imm11 family protein [Amycolatopsis sp. lyj-90]|uniref:imm11 family protein n=1 Tax=Amycolatopsis sp. lyj-90 TaxID=2789285 RepID=UPI00397A9EE4
MSVRVYQIAPPGGFHWINPVDSDDFDRLSFDGKPKTSSWEPVKMELVTKDGDRGGESTDQYTHFPWRGQDQLILRDEAVDKIGPVLDPYGELLPLEGDGLRVAVFNCLTVVDALDEEKSEVGYSRGSGKVREISSYVFRANEVDGLGAFKISQQPGGPLLFTDALVDEFEGAGLSALRFNAVWDSEEGTYGERLATKFRPVDRKI